MAVTGVADADRLLRTDAGVAGQPLSLSKPLGIGVLNSRHKQTGEVFPQAVATMVALNRDASEAALAGGARCVTDVTGFGLLGHLYKLARASNLTAVIDAGSVPYLDGARDALDAGYVSGGTRRNLEWVAPHVWWAGRTAHRRARTAAARRRADERRSVDCRRDSRGADHRRTGPARSARDRGALTGTGGLGRKLTLQERHGLLPRRSGGFGVMEHPRCGCQRRGWGRDADGTRCAAVRRTPARPQRVARQ